MCSPKTSFPLDNFIQQTLVVWKKCNTFRHSYEKNNWIIVKFSSKVELPKSA